MCGLERLSPSVLRIETGESTVASQGLFGRSALPIENCTAQRQVRNYQDKKKNTHTSHPTLPLNAITLKSQQDTNHMLLWINSEKHPRVSV